MGFCEILTLIFIVLKLCGKIDWTWLKVLTPELVALGLYLGSIILYFIKRGK